ncbi:hypothetical protein [Wenyingzhuangia sp. IMCC45574]
MFQCSTIENYKIVALWNIRKHNPNTNLFYRCDDCNTNSLNCCIYKYNNLHYDRGESYVLDSCGKIDSIYSYHVPLGVNTIAVEDQIRLSSLDSIYQHELRNSSIYWDKELNAIVDNDSVYLNFKVDFKNKYLIVKHEKELQLYEFE